MIQKTRKFLACTLSAVLMMPVFGLTASSATEEPIYIEEAGEVSNEAETSVSLREPEEEIHVAAEQVKRFMIFAGECDGYEVYVRPEKYKDEIRTALGDEGEDMIHAFKDAQVVLMENGKPAAELERSGSSETAYISHAGKYLLILQEDMSMQLRYRVSVLDSAYLFLTKDGDTLELYGKNYSEIRAEMHFSRQENGQCIYESSDGQHYAVLNASRDQAWACMQKAAENEKFTLYVDEDTAMLGLQNKETGYIWWSSPLNANRDAMATETIVYDLQSSMVLTYANTGSRGLTSLRSRNGAQLEVKDIPDGVEITYTFGKCGICVPVRFTLCETYLEASVDCSRIRESKSDEGMIAAQLTLLGSFGAGLPDEDGYFVIPDGCGALVYFNNGKNGTYSQRVYGRDLTAVPTAKPACTEDIYMPVCGIVKEKDAMAVVIDKGDGNAVLNASVQSPSRYNLCSFTFQLRGSDTYYLSGNTGTLTAFEKGDIKTEEISLRYYPLSGEDADYAGIAETYRNYLIEDKNVTPRSDSVHLCVSLYGGTMKTHSILGIPVSMKTSITGFSEAQEILSGLSDQGVADMAVVYRNWTDAGISGKVDNKASPAGVLGGREDFRELMDYLSEMNSDFYPAVSNKTFQTGNGYYTTMDTAIRISGSYSRQMTYSLAYGVQDTSAGTKALLSPAVFETLYGELAGNYADSELTGVCLGELTSAVWGDYGKAEMSRDDTIRALQASYEKIKAAGLSILAGPCAAFAFPYADRIADAPIQSSGFDLFDMDIPFYQMVLHGVIPYSGTAVNKSADSDHAFLTSIAMGCDPAFDMMYAQASDLKDTQLNTYFYAHYAYWQDTAADAYALCVQALSDVSGKTMLDYKREGDISVTVYEDGTEIIVNYAEDSFTVNGRTYRLWEE